MLGVSCWVEGLFGFGGWGRWGAFLRDGEAGPVFEDGVGGGGLSRRVGGDGEETVGEVADAHVDADDSVGFGSTVLREVRRGKAVDLEVLQ